ncbi:MAG: hypothetical protein ACRCYZ_03630 [Alphaproteobacteria bacterium]
MTKTKLSLAKPRLKGEVSIIRRGRDRKESKSITPITGLDRLIARENAAGMSATVGEHTLKGYADYSDPDPVRLRRQKPKPLTLDQKVKQQEKRDKAGNSSAKKGRVPMSEVIKHLNK